MIRPGWAQIERPPRGGVSEIHAGVLIRRLPHHLTDAVIALDRADRNLGNNDSDSNTSPRAALPLFATGLGALGLVGWRRKRKNTAAIALESSQEGVGAEQWQAGFGRSLLMVFRRARG